MIVGLLFCAEKPSRPRVTGVYYKASFLRELQLSLFCFFTITMLLSASHKKEVLCMKLIRGGAPKQLLTVLVNVVNMIKHTPPD